MAAGRGWALAALLAAAWMSQPVLIISRLITVVDPHDNLDGQLAKLQAQLAQDRRLNREALLASGQRQHYEDLKCSEVEVRKLKLECASLQARLDENEDEAVAAVYELEGRLLEMQGEKDSLEERLSSLRQRARLREEELLGRCRRLGDLLALASAGACLGTGGEDGVFALDREAATASPAAPFAGLGADPSALVAGGEPPGSGGPRRGAVTVKSATDCSKKEKTLERPDGNTMPDKSINTVGSADEKKTNELPDESISTVGGAGKSSDKKKTCELPDESINTVGSAVKSSDKKKTCELPDKSINTVGSAGQSSGEKKTYQLPDESISTGGGAGKSSDKKKTCESFLTKAQTQWAAFSPTGMRILPHRVMAVALKTQ